MTRQKLYYLLGFVLVLLMVLSLFFVAKLYNPVSKLTTARIYYPLPSTLFDPLTSGDLVSLNNGIYDSTNQNSIEASINLLSQSAIFGDFEGNKSVEAAAFLQDHLKSGRTLTYFAVFKKNSDGKYKSLGEALVAIQTIDPSAVIPSHINFEPTYKTFTAHFTVPDNPKYMIRATDDQYLGFKIVNGTLSYWQ